MTDYLNSNVSVTYKYINFILYFVLYSFISKFDFDMKNVFPLIVMEIQRTLFSIIRGGVITSPLISVMKQNNKNKIEIDLDTIPN